MSSSVIPFSSCPQSLPASVFSNESALRMRWPNYCSFSFSIIPSKEIPGLISFRMDWLDLLAVQGTLKSLLQHHSLKAPILQRSAFFTVQLSHPYMTTGNTIALARQAFVGKVMSLLFNMLGEIRRWKTSTCPFASGSDGSRNVGLLFSALPQWFSVACAMSGALNNTTFPFHPVLALSCSFMSLLFLICTPSPSNLFFVINSLYKIFSSTPI